MTTVEISPEKIKIQRPRIEKTKESIPVSINTDAKYFIDRVDLVINYEDEYGNKFSIEEFKSININDIPWYARFFNLFRRIF